VQFFQQIKIICLFVSQICICVPKKSQICAIWTNHINIVSEIYPITFFFNFLYKSVDHTITTSAYYLNILIIILLIHPLIYIFGPYFLYKSVDHTFLLTKNQTYFQI